MNDTEISFERVEAPPEKGWTGGRESKWMPLVEEMVENVGQWYMVPDNNLYTSKERIARYVRAANPALSVEMLSRQVRDNDGVHRAVYVRALKTVEAVEVEEDK